MELGSIFAVTQCEDLKMKYNEEQLKRRKLYNQVQEAKGSISFIFVLFIIPVKFFMNVSLLGSLT